jgi:DNA-binding transcriptional LysR family regulator
MGPLNLKDVDLNLLVALDALLRERSVTQAGRQMGLSQPSMSAALSRLRELLGDPLLERAGREYRLTPFARDLRAPLSALLSSIERTLESGKTFDPTAAQRRFKIACSDYVSCVLFEPLIERLTQSWPGIRIHLQPFDRGLSSQLTSRRVDLSIQPPGFVEGCASQRLFQDEWVCAVWRGHPDIGDQITREQLYSLPHASFSLGVGSLAEYHLATPAHSVHVHVTSVSFVALPFLVRGTRLVTMIQRRLAAKLQDSAEIRVLEMPVEVPTIDVSMWWDPTVGDSGHAWLRGVIAETAQAFG